MASTEDNWLDIGDSPKITTTAKLPNENTRGKAITKRTSGKSRSWVCDGEYVWFRRNKANPAIKQRLTDQLARGELKHVTTSDDVEIYKVLPSSPFARTQRDLTTLDMQTVVRETVLACCRRDYQTFVDGLGEVAHRIKNARYSDGKPADPNFASMLYNEKVEHIFHLINLRRGPSPAEIDREVSALRARRGEGSGRVILLPHGRA